MSEPTTEKLIKEHKKHAHGAEKALSYRGPIPSDSPAQLCWKAKFHAQTAQRLRELEAERDRLRGEKACTWTEHEDGPYTTSCGNTFEFIDDGPSENGAKFCIYCGGPIVEAAQQGGGEA